MTSDRPTILVELGCFSPALRASGPNSSLVEAVAALSDRFRFRIIAEADAGEPTGVWHELDGCERIALRRGSRFSLQLLQLIRRTPHELLVCNGFFDARMTLPTLILHRAGILRSPLLLAPRGEFSAGALELKRFRKRVYLAGLKAAGLLTGVRFQATDEEEAALIRQALPDARILVGPNIRRLVPLPPFAPAADQRLRVVFASRIDRKKNLDWALRLLAQAGVPVQFGIHGPISDACYWSECQAIIAAMPAHVEVQYRGILPPAQLIAALARYDLFLLPTRGENFGHAIADTLLAGTPALIADTTPWRGIVEAKAGADLSLSDTAPWMAFLKEFAALSPLDRQAWRAGARAFLERRLDPDADRERLAGCFADAMTARPVR